MVAYQTMPLYSKKYKEKLFCSSVNFPFDLRPEMMYIYAAFFAEYTAYNIKLLLVLLARHLSCKLSLVDDFNKAGSIQMSIHAF